MSSRVLVDSHGYSRRTRANTGAASPFIQPGAPFLSRSKSVGALGQPQRPNIDHIPLPIPKETGSIGRGGLGKHGDYSPSPTRSTRNDREARVKSVAERDKAATATAAGGGLLRKLSNSSGESTTLSLASILPKVRPKLSSLGSLARRKGHNTSKSASASPSAKTEAQMAFIRGPEPALPPVPPPFARPTVREPVIRRSISLYDTKAEIKPLPSRPKTPPPALPPRSASLRRITSRELFNRNGTSRLITISSPAAEDDATPCASPLRTVNRYATVYAPAPSIESPPPSSSKSPKHYVKPSLSLTLANGVSTVHKPLLLSPVAASIRSTSPNVSQKRPPPQALLPESPSFSFTTEAWDASEYPPPTASTIASYYYTSTETNPDYRDAISYIERGDAESVVVRESGDVRNDTERTASTSLYSPRRSSGSDSSPTSPALLLPLDRYSALPTPDPISDGKFPPLPPPPKLHKRAPSMLTTDDPECDGDGFTQVLRLPNQTSRSRWTPITPETPALMTPKSNMHLPAMPPLFSDDEQSRWSETEDVAPLKRSESRLRAKRLLLKPAQSFLPVG